MGPQTHADKGRVDEGDTVIPRRGRSTGLGTGTANGNGSFARDAVLREAIKLGVCPEDRARLETLARFAYGTPGFRAVTPISLGEDRARHAVFEVLYTPEGPTARPLDTSADAPTDPSAGEPPLPVRVERATIPAAAVDDPSAASSEPDLPTVLADVASHTPDLMGAFGSTGRKMLWANDSLRRELGVPAWASPPLIELLDDSSQGQFVVRVLPSLLSRGWWQGQLTLVGPDVEPIASAVTIVANHQVDPTGDVLVVTAQPTRKPVPPRRMRGADEHFEALVEHISDLIAVIEPGGSVRYASPAASTMLGLEPGEVAGTPFMELLHPDDAVDHIERLVRIDPADGTGLPVAVRVRSSDGTWRSIEAVVTDLTDNPAIKGYVLNGRDTTERVRANEMLSKLAYTDAETGLPNRLRLLDRMTTLLESPTGQRSVTAIVIDLDDFRAVNESHGPRIGDSLLSEIARRLVEAAGPDAIVARLRSVEFAVAMPDVDDANVGERAAESLRVIVARSFIAEGHSARVTASIGVAVGSPSSQADELLRHAGRAASEAKRYGGNRVVVWGEETARRENRRRAVEQRLHRVLSEGDLRVDYQPVVDIESGELVAAEALLRVRDREDELLNPAEFVEAAESSGLLASLGAQMLETTCEQLSRWDAQLRSRAPDHVCVNVSPRQLLDTGLATQVVTALEASAIEPSRLWLEITESALVAQDQQLAERIAFLHDLGIKVGLDEFGAGHSTLTYLKRFPLDFVKIDRSLVAGLGVDQRDGAIVRATIELAHSLGLVVVAVGVESQAQLDSLALLGCDHAQGYLFSAPVAPDDLLGQLELGRLAVDSPL
jgi:diguanylate cyclase (GGDEF)-like protein/PAS domain S-box-containing protein